MSLPQEMVGNGPLPVNYNRIVRLLSRIATGRFITSDGSVVIQSDIASGIRLSVASSQPLWVKLQAELYLGIEPDDDTPEGEVASVTARLCRWNSDKDDVPEDERGWQQIETELEYRVYPPPDITGYFFSGQIIRIYKCSANGRYYPALNGFTSARCELSEDLEAGGEASAVFADLGITDGDGDPSADVKDTVLGSGESIASGQHIDVVWDVGLKAWKLSGAKCSQVAGGD